jgi:hypothetical protein
MEFRVSYEVCLASLKSDLRAHASCLLWEVQFPYDESALYALYKVGYLGYKLAKAICFRSKPKWCLRGGIAIFPVSYLINQTLRCRGWKVGGCGSAASFLRRRV